MNDEKNILNEFVSEFQESTKPSEYLKELKSGGLLKQLPELESIIGVPQNSQFHPEGDVWSHTLLVCDEAAFLCRLLGIAKDKRAVIMLSTLCHDFGKVEKTFRFFGRLISHGHEKAGIKPASRFLERLELSSIIKEKILKLVEYHNIPLSFYRSEMQRRERISTRAFRKSIERIKPADMDELLLVAEADYCGRAIDYEYIEFNGVQKKRYKPGEWFISQLKQKELADSLINYYMD